MDSIVKKLSEIEAAASSIVENAEAQKAELDLEYQQKRKRFDDDLDRRTSAELQKIRDKLEADTRALLDSQSGNNSDSIQALHREYNEKHTVYAQNILKRITEV